ncbi:MAG: hypothetical protein QOG92_2049 [Verrucomicrobiota bacterium]|nr:hypothetical protein [Verrucomicrobiota bacterium]
MAGIIWTSLRVWMRCRESAQIGRVSTCEDARKIRSANVGTGFCLLEIWSWRNANGVVFAISTIVTYMLSVSTQPQDSGVRYPIFR